MGLQRELAKVGCSLSICYGNASGLCGCEELGDDGGVDDCDTRCLGLRNTKVSSLIIGPSLRDIFRGQKGDRRGVTLVQATPLVIVGTNVAVAVTVTVFRGKTVVVVWMPNAAPQAEE